MSCLRALRLARISINSKGTLPMTSVGIVLLYESPHMAMEGNNLGLYEVELMGKY